MDEGQSVQPFTLYIQISRLQEEIDKIEKEINVTAERLIHLNVIQRYLMTYNTDVRYPLIEGRITNLGKRRSSGDDSDLPVARMTSGGKKWSKKYKAKINCKNPKGFSQKQYCKYGRKKMKGGGVKRKTKRNKSKRRSTRRKRINLNQLE